MRFFQTIFFFLFVMLCFAQSKQFTLYTKSGEIIKYSFVDRPVVHYDESNMILTTNNIIVTYPLVNVRKFTINDSKSTVDLKSIEINDGQVKNYSNECNIDSCNITYRRYFEDTLWQALYVPFEIDYESIREEFDVATINNFHQYDDNYDGKYDRTVLEVCLVKDNVTLLPNYPYLIRAKSMGEKIISLKNVTLYATESNIIDCSSVTNKYIFRGIYDDYKNIRQEGGYYLSGGELCRAKTSAEIVSPFRWYMNITERNSQFLEKPIAVYGSKIRIRIKDDDSDYTGLGNSIVEPNKTNSFVYSISGTKHQERLNSSVYIVKMRDGSIKKVLVK